LDSTVVHGWTGKAKALSHQTYFGSTDSLLKHFRMEDRSEEELTGMPEGTGFFFFGHFFGRG